MCLTMGMMGAQHTVLVPPSARAKMIKDYYNAIVMLHFGLVVFQFVAGQWFRAFFDALAALVGYMSVMKGDQGYNMQQIMCYTIFLGIACVWRFFSCVWFYGGYYIRDAPETLIPFYAYNITMLGGTMLYGIGCYIGVQLWKEVKTIAAGMPAPSAPAAPGGGMFGAPMGRRSMFGGAGRNAVPGSSVQMQSTQAQPQGGAQSGQTATSRPGGFTPFSGTGYRLS